MTESEVEESPRRNIAGGTRLVMALTALSVLAVGGGIAWRNYNKQTEETFSSAETKFVFSKSVPVSATRAKAAGLPAEDFSSIHALDIRGSARFRLRIKDALKLIWLRDRETFSFIKRYIYIINSGNKTEFYMEGDQPAAVISDAMAFRSVSWCAGVIAHQAWHSFAHYKAQGRLAGAPPEPGTQQDLAVDANPLKAKYVSLAAVRQLEKTACDFQLKTLEEIGAPARELDQVANRAPKLFSAGHDGRYTITQ